MDAEPQLTPERVLRRLEWRVIRRLDGRLQGDYRTVFRGAGIDVVDLREYQPGDDLRRIDWNVTARTDTPHVREYLEDREVTAWLVLDRSPSMGFGPVQRRKGIVLAELAATVAQVLARGGNRVGAVLFDTAVQEVIPPALGRTQVLRILSRLLAAPAPAPAPPTAPARARRSLRGRRRGAEHPRRPTALSVPLRAVLGIARRRSLVVLVSDFISEPGWESALGRLAQRHDVVAIQVVDPREFELPSAGMIYVEDAETGEQIFVDSDDPAFRERLRAAAQRRQAELQASARAAGAALFTVSTDEDLVRALVRIAELRRRARR
ncbi:MAG TPA: DUF58 domain-containing protein [Dermatophilaceae bacterium]|nr:DUF58 domain-containing protein [Dermatophilaceae bacterium]